MKAKGDMAATTSPGTVTPGGARRAGGHTECGSIIVETLVAITLLAISIVASSRLITQCLHVNASNRTMATLAGEVQSIVDEYRQMPYRTLLDRFGTRHDAITNDQTHTEARSSPDARSTYTVTLTAIKANEQGRPQAVRVRIVAEHRRAGAPATQFEFETLVTETA